MCSIFIAEIAAKNKSIFTSSSTVFYRALFTYYEIWPTENGAKCAPIVISAYTRAFFTPLESPAFLRWVKRRVAGKP
jgi:hypothetical protein